MNGNGAIGPDGGIQGVLHSERRGSMTAHDIDRARVPRPRDFRSAYERRSRIRRISVLVVCVGAIVALSVLALGPLGGEKAGPGAHSRDSNPPVAAFSFTTASGGHLSVNASASTSTNGIASYGWYFGDWILSIGKFHNHTYTTSGSYNVTLTVTDTIGLTGSTTKKVNVTNSNPPPFPFVVYGQTNSTDGVTPLPNCHVGITDVRTQETQFGAIGSGPTLSDSTGLYSVDISPLYVNTGDNIIGNATGPSGETGTHSGVADTSVPYLGIYITLTGGGIPEFTSIVIPIAGMLSIFAAMRTISVRAKKE